jgi:hypothetical protein
VRFSRARFPNSVDEHNGVTGVLASSSKSTDERDGVSGFPPSRISASGQISGIVPSLIDKDVRLTQSFLSEVGSMH